MIMKLVMILLVRDEADIVSENIRYHLRTGVDFIVAIDNGSVDGTRDILSDFEKAGVLKLIDEPGRNYSQSIWVTHAAQYARDIVGADWIFSNDADEFWSVPSGDLKSNLVDADFDVFTFNRRNMFYPWNVDDNRHWSSKLRFRVNEPEPKPVLQDIYHSSFPSPYLYWTLPPKIMFRKDSFDVVVQGNHAIQSDKPFSKGAADGIIYHYPIRDKEQFLRKMSQGGQAYAKNTKVPKRMGWHWRRWGQLVDNGQWETAIGEAMPCSTQLTEDLQTGRVVEDLEMVECFL